MKINGRKISVNSSPYLVAELSANHNGSLSTALKSIEAAKSSGADAIKIQTFTADNITLNSQNEDFRVKGGLWDGYKLYDLYKKAETPYEWHKSLFNHAEEIGITIFSSPFDYSAVDLLEDLNTPAYKIASPEIIDLPLIKYVAQTKKPMIISTGMANLEEISEAVEIVKENGCKDLILLHCVSGYPTPIEDCNLLTIPDLIKKFNIPVGLSDHTTGISAAVASVALGACIIEKHFTINRNNESPDNQFSLEPDQFLAMSDFISSAWKALGHVNYDMKKSEYGAKKHRRSLYAVKDIKKGESFTNDNVRSIRPGLGMHPKYLNKVLSSRAICDINFGTPISFELISE